MAGRPQHSDSPAMTATVAKAHRCGIIFLLVSLMTCVYMLTYRAVMQSGDTLRALDAVTSLSRYGDWLMDESNWFKPSLRIREKNALPLSEYEVEERLNIQLALPLLKIAEAIPKLGVIHTVWLFNALVTAMIVGLLYLLVVALDFSDAAAVCVAISTGIGSNLWAYSQTFFREPLSAFFILLAFSAIQLGRHRPVAQRALGLLVAGASLYLAYLTKFSAALAIPAALAFALPRVSNYAPDLRTPAGAVDSGPVADSGRGAHADQSTALGAARTSWRAFDWTARIWGLRCAATY